MSAQSAYPSWPQAGPQAQIQLPFSVGLEISIKSIKIRWARSVITAGGILLGIAFFSSVRAAGLFPATGTGPEVIAAGASAAVAGGYGAAGLLCGDHQRDADVGHGALQRDRHDEVPGRAGQLHCTAVLHRGRSDGA
jgi:hypothetical protein